MKLAAALSLLFVFALSLSSVAQTFDKKGVAFSLASDWKVTEEELLEEGKGYYLAAERQGPDESGLITVTWVEGKADLTSTTQGYLDRLKAGMESKNAKRLLFGKVEERKLGKYTGVGADYSFTVMDTPHQGSLFTFQQGGKTITIVMQEATIDMAKNKAGFAEFSKTLNCR